MPRRARGCGVALIGLGVLRLGCIGAFLVVNHWYKWQTGISQGDWLPLLHSLHFTNQLLDAAAVAACVGAILAGRGPAPSEDES